MERKGHQSQKKQTVSQTVKETGGKVEAQLLQGLPKFTQSSSSHQVSHHESSHSSGCHQVSHHESSHSFSSQHGSHQEFSHGSISHRGGHHESSHGTISHRGGHHESSHGTIPHRGGHHEFSHGSVSHRGGHQEFSHGSVSHHGGHHESREHHEGHINGSERHQATTHCHGSVSHHETLKEAEPIKVTASICGFFVAQTKEKVGIYQALQKKLVPEKVALALLEAQAATGHIIDPSNNKNLTLEAAIQQGIIGPEYQQKLLLASSAATGYKYKKETLSLFQAFKKGLVGKNDAVRLLQAQIATGGIVNHATGSRVPFSEALTLGCIDENLFKLITGPSEFSSCYPDPNSKEDSSYQELLSKCFTDSGTGLVLLTLQESLQGLRKSVNLEQMFKANIITQVQYDEIREGKQTIQKVGELQEVRQYLNGLSSIGGVYVERTKEKISIYQALKRNFLSTKCAVALLEAQAASGFIIDPEKKKTFTVTEAVQEGVVGFDLKEKLLNAERAVTGFNDLYTGKKISLFQAIKKELIDRNLGLNLLQVQLATGGIVDSFHSFHVPLEIAFKRGLLDEDTAKLLSNPTYTNGGFLDPNTNDRVTYQELRSRSTFDPDSNAYFFNLKLAFQGIRGKVTSNELLDSQIIDQTTYENLQQGKLSIQDVAEQENVKRYLQGTGLIAGVADISTNEIKSIYQAMKEHLLMPGTSIALLEAQAATGYLIDPVKNLKFSVHDAVKNGLIGPELYEKVLSAEKAAKGYKDPSSGERLSLFQAIKKGFVTKDHGTHLLNVQLATGGIIDPLKKHRVPVAVAYSRGHFDDDTNKYLLTQTGDIKGFFDPNLKENVTYEQLLERSVIDLRTGLYLTPVFDNAQDAQKISHSFIDYKTKMGLDGIKLTLTFGKFKGLLVSLWQILFSEYFSVELRRHFISIYKTGSLSVEELSGKVEAEIKQAVSSTKILFEGLRESVTPGQLLESEIIDKSLFNKLQQGEASAQDVVNIDSVKKYLQGTGSIGGLILADTQEKISIYQAKRKGFLRPGTSLILLEAQAATGYIIDPVKNKKYSVEQALKANIIGPDYYEKLLSAEKSVTGYKDPYTGERISLFQAMSKDLIVNEHGIRLLEAQIATGGIIDPINSHRIPVEVAYKRGYFDKKMNLILSDPSDDTKGFFDPNTNENLTYLQLKEKCITEPSTNLCLLPLVSKQRQFSINDQIRDSFKNVEIYVRYGRFQGQTLSAWFLINSEYFTEWRRRELLDQFRLKKLTLEQITIIIEEEIMKWTEIRVPALRGQVNIYELLEYEIIEKELLEQILEGKVTIEEVFKMDKVQKCLQGSGVLGGVIIQPSNKKVSFYEATKNNILLPSTILPLLEAQAATGHIVNPANNQKLSVDDAIKAAVVDPQIYERLASAEEATKGYIDPFSGKKISLFQAMKKGLIEEKHAKQLLEAQLATGGVIDPIHGFHLPDSVAKKHGYLSEELLQNVSHPTDDKSFYDPTTKEKVTYSELLSRAYKDESTGLYLLPLPQDFAEVPVINLYSDEEVRQLLKTTRIEERNTTVWDLIHSGYFTEEQQFEILEKFRAKKLTIQELIIEILQIVRTNEIKRTTHINFQGLRGNVPVVWLLDLGIITQKTFDELVQGLKSVEEISQLAEVKKSLQGTGSISGVFLPSTKEKLSIYQALKKNLLLPANAIMLLEAQAATGFIIDPVKNEKYTVDSAVKAGLVGPELHEKLLTAESAVSGYTDPYTGNKISVGQAIQKKLIPDKEGIPLLQAQLAAGGIIDPLHGHYVPIQLAYKLGFLGEEISKQTADLKVYVDPNTKEKVSYEQLKERCYTDPETGSLLLALSETAAFYAEGHFIDVFKSYTVTVNAGRFKGQTVSLWELLNSEYISADKLKEFLLKYKTSSSEALQEIIKTVTTIFEETDAHSTQIKFKGLRKQVSASDLFQSEVIDKKTLDELNLGKKTIDEVTEMDTVKRYLQGTNSIAGILLQATNKKMSIYEAMLKGILRPGTALVLLEAQAATGFVIDPVKNEKLSVDEAFAQGLIGSDVHAKLLSAEQAVTGYKDPYTGEKISLFQAMQKSLIVETHGIRLLEAQIATGGIIDPVHSHRVPVEVAYKLGYFNEEMNRILSDPSDDTKGFFDPNTHENLTYLQLVERCIQDPETGLHLLQVVKRGENYFYITEKMKADLQSRSIRLQFGRYANQTVSIWEILNSHYITDMKRRELVRLYTLGVLTIDQLIYNITTVIEEYESKSSNLKLKGIRGEVSATDLYNADIIDRKTLVDLNEGKISVEAVSELDSVRRYLKGTSCIAGVLSLPTNETLSIYEAISRGILSRDIGLALLQAQAATGHLIDPIKNQVLSIPDAVSQGLVNADIQEQLEIAEKAVTGYTDESGNRISLFQAIKKGSVPKEQGIALLDVQLATGGVVDPVYSHRLPLHVAYQRAYLDEDFYLLISDSGKKGFVDPNTHERITYKNLLERCVKDQKNGLYLLPLTERHDDYFYIDEPTKKLLQETNVTMNSGKFKGQDISLWELLSSTYISEEKRKQLIKLYKTKTSSTLKDVTNVIISIIGEKEKGQNEIWFQGLRKQVTAAELLDAGIINQETLDGLKKDLQTVTEVSKIDSIRQYLQGTNCIAGVLIPSKLDPTKKEKVNIYDAMLRRVLRPGTALVLLEAQAATGFVIDSIQNRRLSVDEALSAGVIGYEIYEKLLSAERGVTGYNDPYTGEKISLFQAMQKDLIVKEHGIRLLESQIATGGIIDPIHSHRVPVEVAYKRGYFDEELNQILLDPTDDTKGFFDPNTHENLTYLQLLQRCVQDPDTGLYMLELKDSKFTPAQIQNKLQSSFIQIAVGEFQGKSLSIWEFINSKYFSAERREELLRKYESGSLTIEEIMAITIRVLNETEQTVSTVSTTVSQADTTDAADQETKVQNWLQSEKVTVSVGDFKGQNISVWELLNSHYISEEKRKEILEKIQSGSVSLEEIITILITIITETETTEVVQKSVSVPDERPVEPDHFIQDDEIEKALQNISIHVTKGQHAGQDVSLWYLLNSRYIPEDIKHELLEEYKLTVQDIMELVVHSIRETEQQGKFKTVYKLKVEVYNVLQTMQIEVTEGEFKGQKHSVWDLLNSKYFSEEKRSELLQKFNSGIISISELINIIITIITETEERSKKLKFKGLRRQITASELLTSEIIDQNTLRELAQGQKTVEDVTQMDSVKRYLEGTSCIAGVLVPNPKDPSKKDKMSIYDAMLKNILRPGTALVLLEAQAATGFITDPVKNKKLSVDEAAAAGLIGHELHAKLLSAEKAVTGYTDPYTGDKISLFQAMQKDLIVKDHGIRLLEAQIATGGIIDPVHSHRVPVEVAYKRGYFDEEMNQILSDPTDDTKGFFDPNTHENLTYLQLLSRCVQDPDTGLYMLSMKDKQTILAEKALETSLRTITIRIKVGQYEGQTVSSWELLHSKYFTEEKRQLLLNKYKSKTLTEEELISSITSAIEDREQQDSRQTVDEFSLEEAVQAITEENLKTDVVIEKKEVIDFAFAPKLKHDQQPDTDEEHKALSVFTVHVQAEEFQGKRVSLWEVLHSKYVSDDSRNTQLRKHQAAVEKLKLRILGFIEDTETKAKPEVQQTLELKLVEVNVGEFKGQNVSLWFLLYSKYITEEKRTELLEKYKLGTLTEDEIFKIIITIIEETEENLKIKREKEIQQELELKLTEVTVGEFKGQNVSVWFLLYSKYITEEKRNELLEKYKSGTLTADEILKIIITIIEETEKRRELKFKGFRRQVTASELLQSEIIDQSTLDELTQGNKTVEEVTQMDSVKRYLEGSSSIAGVFAASKTDPSKREKLTIYDAMLKRILRPGTALILLEAQAATGFVIDPIQNKKLSVEEALTAGLIGNDVYDKLLSAERGVTGYNDPYTGDKISLFQAMKKDLIVKDHGIRLLEAQIATGGIIDPVHSHRVPVEVAYKRGYFDEEMNQILSDPSDDTKGFFDPNTHENLTYLQLLQRCVQDPETSLYMLDVNVNKVPSTQTGKENILKTKNIRVAHTQFQDRDVSIWELLYSVFISTEKREELLQKYNSGTLSIDELITILITLITETVPVADTTDSADKETLLRSEKVDVSVGDFKGQPVTVWELLNSHYITEEKRKEILEKYKNGILTIQEIITILITTITESETEVVLQTSTIPVQLQIQPKPSLQEDEIQKALKSINIHVRKGEYAGQEVSVWNLLHSKYILEEKRQELLGNYKLTLEDIIQLVVQTIEGGDQKGSLSHFKIEYNLKEELFSAVQTTQIELTVGEFKGQKQSVLELLNSNYFSEEKRLELLEQLNSGTLNIDGLIKIIITIIQETEESSKNLKFKGLRRQVTATELLTSEIIDQNTLRELAQGQKTVEEVTQMDNVKRYLEGTSCIAGVLVASPKDPSKKDKMSIYDAMLKNILRPGTALILLEAQAATGFIIDPVNNKKLSVDEAADAGLFGRELHAKLLSAEKAVTGYNDPTTGNKISLFQAIQKDLIVKDHGIRLLEAQIATGGIIDPVHSHRVPVEVAYKRGYFDAEMNQILSDPTDDTKGFFDPNTHENLTYLQLLSRCVKDPDTGLYMLSMKDKQPVVAEKTFGTSFQSLNIHQQGSIQTVNEFSLKQAVGNITEESKKSILQSELVEITKGKLKGQKFSVWDLLSSEHIEASKKEELLQKYFSGALTLEEIVRIITVIITEGKEQDVAIQQATIPKTEETVQIAADELQRALNAIVVNVKTSALQEQKISLWDGLHSNYLPEDKRNDQLTKHKLTVENLKQIITSLVEESETKKDNEIQQALDVKLTEVTIGEFKGQNVSVWFLLHSKYVTEEKRQELVEKYVSGTLTDEEILRIIITIIEETEQTQQIQPEKEIQEKFELKLSEVNVGEFKGQNVSLWFLLNSKYITEEKRTELLEKYKLGSLTEDKILRIIITIIEETEQTQQIQAEKEIQEKFELKLNEVNVGEFKGQNVSLWFLLNSKYITEEKRIELLEKYKLGSLTEDEIFKVVITIIEETEQTQQIQPEKEIQEKFKLKLNEVNVGEFKGQNVSLWFLLYSKYITEEKRTELLEKYKLGSLTEDEIFKVVITIIEETEQTQQIQPEKEIQEKFKLKLNEVNVGEFKGQNVSLWFLLYSKYITEEKRTELLEKYKLRSLTEDEISKEVITIIEETEQTQQIQPEKEIQEKFELKLNEVNVGEFKGQNVSLWFLLYSKYITEEKRTELLEKYKLRSLTEDEISKEVITIIEETEQTQQIQPEKEIQEKFELKLNEVNVGEFKGQNVSLWFLLYSKYITEEKRTELLEKYKLRSLTEDEISKEVITIIEETEQTQQIQPEKEIQEKFELKLNEVNVGEFKGQNVSLWFLLYSKYITEEKRTELLEKYKLRSLTEDEISKEVITIIEETEQTQQIQPEKEIQEKFELKLNEVNVGEFKGQNVSLWFLLYSKYITEEKRTELLEKYKLRSLTEDEISKEVITIIEETEQTQQIQPEKEIQEKFELKLNEVNVGEFKGQNVSLWFLLYSKYITEEKRTELLEKYKLRSLTEDEISNVVITIIEETEQTQQIQPEKEIQEKFELKLNEVNVGEFKGQSVSLWFLLNSKYITEEKRTELLEKYKSGSLTEDEIFKVVITIIEETEQTQQIQAEKEIQEKFELKLSEVNVGEFKGQNVSLWFLLNSKYITEEKRTELLEKYKLGSLTEDTILRIIITIIEETEQTQQIQAEKEIQEKFELKLNEVNAGEFKGQNVSLWFLLNSKYITEEKRIELLQKYKLGSLTEDEIFKIVITIIEETEVKREKEIQQELELKLTEVTTGEFKGQNVSIWFLLYSKYITEEKRNELLEKYKSGTITIDEILKIIITIIEETEKRRELKFKGLRRQVTASELLQSEIIDQSTLDELTQGNKTVEEVTQMDSVKRYLEGSSSIAGVFVTSKTDPSKREKLTIYDAMLKRILRPGTALILLEAQAATGFMIDPIQNKKLSVEEALTAGLIGNDVYDKLLSAERGVTGYNDPYTGDKISLFQAMKKDLIVKDHGIRLLEAQIATGGIIDPVHSHRVPVEVAYKRGYFDEEMNQILSDPSDDTKGFFDPNTHENLTYLQLLQRCVQDPETGLYMLDVRDGQQELKIKSVLQSKSVQISVGEFQGKNVSVWDLLYSRYISVEKQQELLQKYRAGTMTIEELITILITIITDTEKAEKEEKLSPEIKAIKKSFLSVIIEISIGDFQEKAMSLWDLLNSKYIPDDKRDELIEKFKTGTLTIEEIINIVLSMIQKEVRSTKTVIVQETKIISGSQEAEHWPSEDQLQKALEAIPSDLSRKPCKVNNVSVWKILHSQNVPEDKRNALLQTYKACIREVMSICTNLVKETAAEGSTTETIEKQNLDVKDSSQGSAQTQKRLETQSVLQSVEVDVTVGHQESKSSSLWELLHSSYVTSDRRNELLGGYESGTLGLQDLMQKIMQILMEAEKTSVKISSRQKVTQKTEQISLESIPEPVIKSLQIFTVSISSTEFTGDIISLWTLLQSKNITKEKRLELLKKYLLTIKGIITMVTGSSSKTVTVVTQKPDTATFLKSVRVQVNIGEFQLEGQSHSLWELLHSQYVAEEKRKELIQQYESGAITWEQMFNIITTIIKETEEKTHNIKFKE
ncbi:epiplakin [Mantella aurantiaca]